MAILNTILGWIKAHKIAFTIIVILLFLVPIILVQVFFSIPALIPSFASPLSAGDLLGYYATFIATAGTVFLGFVAVKQNQIIAENEEKYQKQTAEREEKYQKETAERENKLYDAAVFCYKVHIDKPNKKVIVHIKNFSHNSAYKVSINKAIIIDADGIEYQLETKDNYLVCLDKNMEMHHVINLDRIYDSSDIMTFMLAYHDICGNEHQIEFTFEFKDNTIAIYREIIK